MSKQSSTQIPAHTNGNSPTLTPLTDFRELRINGRVDTFKCSGRVVRWRPVNLSRALRSGKIPDHLTAYVAKRVWTGSDSVDERSDVERVAEWGEYLDWVAQNALVYPTVTDHPTEQEIMPDDLFDPELQELELWATYPLSAVRPFPGTQGADVDIGTKSREVGETA
jgi:hypothetical protein